MNQKVIISKLSISVKKKRLEMSKVTHPKQIRQYTLSADLGHGAYSTVCKAFSKTARRNFAIKIFPKTNLREQGGSERFQREINSMACLRHENLVALYDFFWDDNNFYMVIDYCPGGELFDYIVKHDHLEEPVAALVFKQIVSAIHYCHSKGVAHRDLKPENVLIDRFPHIKVSDFGLCGFINTNEMMKTFCGSPAYCAPECLSKIQYDGRLSDVWSLGTILYAMVTGDNPWNCSNTSKMIQQILAGNYTVPDFLSEDCKSLITSMLVVNPSDRISVQQILDHPWLELASEAKIKMPPKARDIDNRNSQLPPLGNNVSMGDLHDLMIKTSNYGDSGFVSPFEKEPDEDENDDDDDICSARLSLSRSRMPSLPTLCVRSASIENFNKSQSGNLSQTQQITPIKDNALFQMKRSQPGNLSLSANRQRSAALLIPKKPMRPKGVEPPTLRSGVSRNTIMLQPLHFILFFIQYINIILS